jgi:hypothetical protein
MSNISLTTTPLSCNEISDLTYLFEQSFLFHYNNAVITTALTVQNYLKNIRTVVGLGFTATLVQNDLTLFMERLINKFIRYQNFYRYPEKIQTLASTLVSLISCSSDFFRDLGHPSYCDVFEQSLAQCIQHIIHEIGIQPIYDTRLAEFKYLSFD